MTRRVTQLLSPGIAHLKRGGTIEEYMRQVHAERLPLAEREELHDLMETAADLTHLLETAIPLPRAQAVNRARFLGEAAQLREERLAHRTRRGLSAPVHLLRVLLGLTLALALVLTAGGGVVRAAAASLPGSSLYPFKLAVEDARLGLAFDPATRARLCLRFADERATEMVRLAMTGRPANEDVVNRMARQLQIAVQSAQAAGGELESLLLEQLIANSAAEQERLHQARAWASPEARAMLDAGAMVAEQASRQALELLQIIHAPSATETAISTMTVTPTPIYALPAEATPTATATAVVTPPTSGSPAGTSQPTRVPTFSSPTASLTPTPTPEGTVTPSRTPMHPLTPSRTPSVSPIRTATYTPKPSSTPVPTATPEETPTPTHGPGVTPSPTDTPQAIFRLTLKDNPDPVPATHRIHYNLCLFNDGEIALTHVVIVDTWKPRECVYLAPDNPPNITWNVGTLNPHQRFCVEFALDTYSICGGRTATNEAVMTCDQGTALVSESTRIGPTPVPVATQTATATETETLTPTATPEGS